MDPTAAFDEVLEQARKLHIAGEPSLEERSTIDIPCGSKENENRETVGEATCRWSVAFEGNEGGSALSYRRTSKRQYVQRRRCIG